MNRGHVTPQPEQNAGSPFSFWSAPLPDSSPDQTTPAAYVLLTDFPKSQNDADAFLERRRFSWLLLVM